MWGGGGYLVQLRNAVIKVLAERLVLGALAWIRIGRDADGQHARMPRKQLCAHVRVQCHLGGKSVALTLCDLGKQCVGLDAPCLAFGKPRRQRKNLNGVCRALGLQLHNLGRVLDHGVGSSRQYECIDRGGHRVCSIPIFSHICGRVAACVYVGPESGTLVTERELGTLAAGFKQGTGSVYLDRDDDVCEKIDGVAETTAGQ